MRKVVTEIIDGSEAFRVIGTARNGHDALRQIHALDPEIVTLDVEMPELGGIETLGYIMSETPRPVVMLSAAQATGRDDPTLRALELGALDFVRKPSGPISLDMDSVAETLLHALAAALQVNLAGVRMLARPRFVQGTPRGAGASGWGRRAAPPVRARRGRSRSPPRREGRAHSPRWCPGSPATSGRRCSSSSTCRRDSPSPSPSASTR